MSAPKSVQDTFQSEWNKAAAWAASEGIPANAYLPVYQMDSARLQSGENIMSAAERNRAILAANNPNDVTPLPSDNPNPSSIFANARTDLGMIATGLEPQHLIGNLFDTFVNTAKDIIDPERLVGKNLDATAANLLQDTLLSFVPGAYDIGTLLKGGGIDALAEHPLVSLLDLLPAGSSKLLTGALTDSATGARLADAAGLSSSDLLRQQSLQKTMLQVLTHHVPDGKLAKVGVDPSTAASGIQNLSIGQRLQNWLGNSKLGTSAPIQKIVSEYVTNNQMYTGVAHNILEPAIKAWSALTDEQKGQYDEIFDRIRRGDDEQRVLADPTIPLVVRDAAEKMIRGPLRFAREEAVAARDVTMLQRPDGSWAAYSSKQSDAVLNARDALAVTRVKFVTEMDATDRLRVRVEAIDQVIPKITADLTKSNDAARRVVESDDSLVANVLDTSEGAKRNAVLGTKKEMAGRIFGNGGMVDAVLEQAKTGDTEALAGMTKVLQSRLKSWGRYSVDATSNPAFKTVSDQVDALAKYAGQRSDLNRMIDDRIMRSVPEALEERDRQREVLRETQKRQSDELRANQTHERHEQSEGRRAAISKARADLEIRLQELTQIQNLEDTEDRAIRDNAMLRAEPGAKRAISRQITEKINARHSVTAKAIRDERAKYEKIVEGINRAWDHAAGALSEKQRTARAELHETQKADRADVGGPLIAKMREYTKTLDDFHRAVYENPSDEYRDMRSQVYEAKLLESDHGAALLDATEKRLVEASSFDEGMLAKVRSNPKILGELVAEMTEDIYRNPENFDPEIVEAATEARTEAHQQALVEIQKLIDQKYHPMWLPAAGAFESPSFSIRSLVGKGEPHVDVAHSRANGLVNTRYSVVLGVTKAVADTLRRDATRDFMEESIVPRAITGTDLGAQLKQFGILGTEGPLAGYDPSQETILSALSRQAAKLGLAKVPKDSFDLSLMPRYANEDIYLPAPLLEALRKMKEIEGKGDTGIFDKTNKLFRMSILGLSPRYTAHIVFGGTFLLALRSTPYMPAMLRDAAKALREGSLPQEIFRTPTQEGVTHLQTALSELHWAGGKQLSNLVLQENLSRVQRVAMGKASPFHILKAAADVNYRFTHYAVRLQSAVAYLDYAARAERRGSFVDEVTGETVTMSKERAMHEGMQHVEEVFGNLRSMSPLERSVAKNILPFYGWTRHILNYVMSFPADHPWRAMVLSLMAYENSADVPKGLPERIQFLFFLGQPDAQGNVSAVDDRFMDPLRDVANYATIGGWLQGLNPALLAPLVIVNPQVVYGSQSLYPNVTYDQFYGIETASDQGNVVTGLEQFIPQLGALSSAITAAGDYRQLASTDKNGFYKSVFESLNIPFAQVQKINVKQIAAHDETARYEVAKQAASNAFESGDFSSLKGYASVPNPLNPDYDISPAQLQALYNEATVEYPGTAPIEVLTPPPTPYGF